MRSEADPVRPHASHRVAFEFQYAGQRNLLKNIENLTFQQSGKVKAFMKRDVSFILNLCMHVRPPDVIACQLNPWLGGDNRSRGLKTWSGAALPSGLAATLALLPQ